MTHFEIRLENLLLEMALKVLKQQEETYGDYIDPTKAAILQLIEEMKKEDTK
jgi:hypothetical protein